ncbi:Na+/H+-dicarboxylate symporter [Cerasibacillus quisquiliarum]|uniref:Dicarboxylate:amino acid:cation symporter DAACS family protein n=1 Tax=Cerasibacillus quisquiliarum TaxID=227865 RepID=A0A511V1X0_9BACI|nr:dicarboxylate/amino acid:cation symporter [Cerasibacillus quisquiliarum]MBB5147020.1 Na+/H+-dicarboxylate symporter [Cerasibacillus quisquiliarum]GEN31908.1 dicarboxylate:amino acid:cation symporter DAACS family protein [Cerasibacillus quisquiliarum]
MRKNLIWQILIAFVLAIISGVIFGDKIAVVAPLGDLFLRLIKFIIVPLILSTIIVGITSTEDVQKLGRLGGKTVAYYLLTSLIAISLGLFMGSIFKPGLETDIKLSGEKVEVQESEGVIDTILNIVPTNPIESLVTGDILQIIFFAIFIGIGITLVGKKADPVKHFFEGFAEIMYKITGIVMAVAPIGIYGLLAPVIGEYGAHVLLPLFKLIIAMLITCLIHIGVIYSVAVKTWGNMSPITFIKGMLPAAMVAFSTSSSSGTLPVTMKCVEDDLKVSKDVSSFVLPLGATINMDGTAIYQGLTVMFIAQYYGVDLTLSQLGIVALIATFASIGTAGVPGAGMIMLTMVLTAVNLPLEGIALVAGIDRILDMMRTTVNIVGDASASVVVDASEKRRAYKEERVLAG